MNWLKVIKNILRIEKRFHYMNDAASEDEVYYDDVFYSYSDCENCGLVLREIVNRGFSSGDYKCPQCHCSSEYKMEMVKNVYGNIIIEWEKQSRTSMEIMTFRDLRELNLKLHKNVGCIGIMKEW